jgi:hypothetical protein
MTNHKRWAASAVPKLASLRIAQQFHGCNFMSLSISTFFCHGIVFFSISALFSLANCDPKILENWKFPFRV